MDFIPCSLFLPDAHDTRKRTRFDAGVVLLADDNDYVGVGFLMPTPDQPMWKLLDGTMLPLERVTRWSHLRNPALRPGEVCDHELHDEDGYPTDVALDLLEHWSFVDPKGWVTFARRLWHFKDIGFHITPGKEGGLKISLSTLGWSGNESVIAAMKRNTGLWHSLWHSTERGGHYRLELEAEEGNENPGASASS